MSEVRRGVLVALAVAVLVGTCGCSKALAGKGTLVEGGAIRPAPTDPGPGATATASPTPSPTPSRRRDPATVARAVDIRAGDLPAGWREISGSRREATDSLSWVIACARDAGVGPGSLSGADTPDFSATGTARSSQVGTATGLFADDAAAARYVALFRDRTVGRCMAAEAGRTWSSSFSAPVPAFTPGTVRVASAAEAAGLATTATRKDGQRLTIQFHAIRTGPIVTMLDTIWIGAADPRILNAVAARIGSRQRTA
jgi:hypothetical protein